MIVACVVLVGCGGGRSGQTVSPAPTSASSVSSPDAEAACPGHGGRWDSGKGCVLAEETPKSVQHLLVPVQWTSSFPELQTAVDAAVTGIRNNFRESALRAWPSADGKPYSLDMTFDAYQGGGAHPVDSVRLTVTESLGGYHPQLSYRTISFDRVTKRSLTIETLLVDAANGMSTIATQARDDLHGRLSEEDTAFVDQGTSPDAANFHSFVLDGDSVVFFFEPYQVAPYAAGPQQSRLALSALRDVVKPEYIPA